MTRENTIAQWKIMDVPLSRQERNKDIVNRSKQDAKQKAITCKVNWDLEEKKRKEKQINEYDR